MQSPARRAHPTRRLAVAVLLAFAVTACGADEPGPSLDAAVVTLDGDPANLSDFVGTPVVVNFFAESCPPCVSEMPAFESVAAETAGEVVFVGVSEDATEEAARRIVEQTGVTYAVVWDRDGSALAALEALGLPTTLFVDAGGTVVDSHTGALSADGLREILADVF